MLRSIRWRLVMGTMLLTLLTVSAVGIVALLLTQRYMVQQERAYLTANAEAIANQAVTFMSPVQFAPPLQQLAQTAAFLGDVTVRIVDNAQMPLADSAVAIPYTATLGIASAPIYFQVAAPVLLAVGDTPPSGDSTWIIAKQNYTKQEIDVRTTAGISMVEPMPGQVANVIVVQKSPSIWGDRLVFDAAPVGAGVAEPVAGSETGAAAPVSEPFVSEPHVSESFVAAPAVPAEPAIAYAVAPVDMDGPSVAQAMPVQQELKVAGSVISSGARQGADTLLWERKMDAYKATYVGSAIAKPSLLQTAGLQALDVVTAPIRAGGVVVGFVELGRTTDLVNEPLGAIRRALGIAAGASSLLAIAVGLVMSRTLTSPIQNLAQAAAAMSNGDLTARAPVVGRDELAALARQFNQMADALHQSFAALAAERDTLRRFVADASHELRTPITALRTFNELLQGPASQDQCAQAEFLAESHLQIARLEWITRNLLDLSRWDGGMATLTLREVEVGSLVIAAAAPFRTLAQERQIDLRVVVPETPLVACVDEQRLGMAVGNLLDNALKFTPCAGVVEVGVSAQDGGLKIWVEDTGMGIGAEELPRIFERFYRSPRATQGGSGLGLAIVERIVNAHQATIEVASVEGAGSRFTVFMPTGKV